MITRVIACGLAASLAIGTAGATAKPKATPKAPPGAVKASEVKTVPGFACGKVKGAWVPGKSVKQPKGFFIPLSYDASVAAKKAKAGKGAAKKAKAGKGAAKKGLTKTAEALRKKVTAGQAACNATPRGATPTLTPGPSTGGGNGGGGPNFPVAKPPKFALQDAVALALSAQGTSSVASVLGTRVGALDTAENLVKVLPSGAVASTLVSGTANVQTFLAGPNGKIYVRLNPSTPMVPGRPYQPPWMCYLAEVDVVSGDTICIEESSSITWDNSWWGSQANPSLQVDAQGAIYYRVSVSQGGTYGTVVRRYANGVRSDLTPPSNSVYDFAVVASGGIVATGSSTGASSFVRAYRLNGSWTNLVSSPWWSGWVRQFPDGRVYFNDPEVEGISVWDGNAESVYMSRNNSGGVDPSTIAALCGGPQAGICGSGGGFTMSRMVALGSEAFMVEDTKIVRIYPSSSARTYSTTANQISLLVAAGNRLAIVGNIDPDGGGGFGRKLGMTIFNPADGSQANVWSGTDIEIYSATYDGSGSVIVSASNSDTGNLFNGTVDVSTQAVTETGSSKLQQVQLVRR